MTEQADSYYSVLLLLAALVSVLLTVVAWRRRAVRPSAKPMALLGFAMAWWCLTHALHWSAIYRPTKNFWLDVSYIGAVLLPASFLAFALCYTHREHCLKRWVVVLLSIEPVLTLVLVWTDQQYGLFFAGKRHGEDTLFSGGFGYWLNIVYSYTLVLIAFLLLYRAFVRSPRLYRQQTGLILFGAALPWIISIISLLGVSPFPNLDWTPIAFVLTGITFSLALFHPMFSDLIPIAHTALMKRTLDGVLVLDEQNHLMAINPTAVRLLRLDTPIHIDQPVESVIPHWAELVPRHIDAIDGHDEIQLDGSPPSFLEVRIIPLADRDGNFAGRLITFRDITNEKETELELRRVNQRLQLQLSEIETLQAKLSDQAVRDPLTGLFNRRHLQEMLEGELLRARRKEQPLSLILLDIDHLKLCNDTYGTQAGDVVLRELANMLEETTRDQDTVCRYGGSEFLVVLPDVATETAHQRAEQWRLAFQNFSLMFNDTRLELTVSVGVASFPQDGESVDDLLRSANQALYRAKEGGRNQVAK